MATRGRSRDQETYDDSAIESSRRSNVKAKPRLSKRAKWWILASLLAIFTLSTLAGIPIGSKPNPSVAVTEPYMSIRNQMLKQDPEHVVPNNIYDASVVPANSTFYQLENLDQGNGQFDRSVSYLSPLSNSKLNAFGTSFASHFGWKIMTKTQKNGTDSYYLQKAGQDGNVWEMLFQISPPPANLTSLNSNISSVITERILITSFQ
ncbi:MAG: hypothetical protein M0019_07425 [Actinomycetota bacterium]|nr:hypothetical protein [Actinomycetota bacterium]